MQFRLGDTTASTDTSGGMADAATAPSSWLNSLVTGFTQYQLGRQQLSTAQQVTDMNLKRIAAGLPPINIDPSALGAPSVQVGLSSGTQQLILYGLMAAGGLFMLNLFLKHR